MAMRWCWTAAIAVWMFGCLTTTARADSISMKTGGVLRGELLTAESELATAADITIRTLSGAEVALVRDEIDRLIRRSPILEEYEVRRRAAADTADAQWALGLWCHQNSLFEERDQHLRRVIDFERSHKGARRMLGHYQAQGRWLKPGEYVNDRGRKKGGGRVKVTGSFRLPADWDLLQNSDWAAAEKDWAARVKALHGRMMTERRGAVGMALIELRMIRDPDAVPALERYLQGQLDHGARLIVLEILSSITGDRSLPPLVSRSLRDSRSDLREAALGAVLKVGSEQAIGLYSEALRDPQRTIVNRAAYALGVIGDQDSVPALSDALATPEEYEVWTLTPDAVTKTRRTSDRENPEVLRALILLTGENFGYDKPSWRTWFAEKNNLSVRRQASGRH